MVRLATVWLLAAACVRAGEGQWTDRGALEKFLLADGEKELQQTMQMLFPMEKAGALVTVAAKAGPAYMTRAAGAVSDDAFRSSYTQLGQYVDRAGGCFKQAHGAAEGWWSNYPDVAPEACSELVKLIAGKLLWNQVHYCRELLTKKAPEGRLDAAPVQSPYLKAEAAYEVADALLRLGVGERPENAAVRRELQREKPSRELVAIEAAKMVLERWEAMHLEHLDRKQTK